jgi:pyruvate/2-oxoglutarate dehydrogenase complex dihydrolipoamide dehydrogenase (E3) component
MGWWRSTTSSVAALATAIAIACVSGREWRETSNAPRCATTLRSSKRLMRRLGCGWLKVDPATLEVQPGVFGAGDVTGLGGFTHLAYYHGQVVARRLRGIDARADHTAVPRVTFTDPEIASVGLSEAAARARAIDVIVASADPAESARGSIHDFHRGALKLVADASAAC